MKIVLLLLAAGALASPTSVDHVTASGHKLRQKSFFLQADGDKNTGINEEDADAKKPKLPWHDKNSKNDTFDHKNPLNIGAPKKEPPLQCGITTVVGAHTDKYADCPASCPYFAQNRVDTQHCSFLCVPGDECGRWNPNKPIPDTIKKSKTCRGPKVAFCSISMLDGSDTCEVCQTGFALHEGQCFFSYWITVMGVTTITVLMLTVAIVWFVDLCCRENLNQETVTTTVKWRNRSRNFMPSAPDTPDAQKRTWPVMSTNMCSPKHDIGGPGMCLHFNFQAFFILWPIFVAMVWVVLACMHNELFILGTRKFGTPRHNCILVAWGYETQQRLMWTKVLFLAVVYVVSFISFLLFSVRQLRIYQEMDTASKTMKDFTLELKGFPPIPGSVHDLEKDIQKAVEDATNLRVVGVSVAWNYAENAEAIDYACVKDLIDRENQVTGAKPLEDAPNPTENMGAIHTWMYEKEKGLLGPDEPPITDDEVKPLLEKIMSSDMAYVVFGTEEEKDTAVKLGSFKFDATKYGLEGEQVHTVEVNEVGNEPSNVNWQNFDHAGPSAMMSRFFYGLFTVYVPALLVWFFGFYVPYACALYYFNYDNGAELPGYYSIIFTIVVCGGNATMYVVCDICCDIIGFRYKDTKQKVYMLMYLCACMINVFLDMVVTYYTAMKIMIGQDFRTYHGARLAEIEPFTEQFETYAMQRSLGENTYAYAWPSTFFLCFVLEPFVTIWIPLYIGKIVVRTHPEIRGSTAEAYLQAFEFDMGRYADILLNVFLGILIFWFPGGYIWTLFFAMSFSHCFIYCFDHWRVITVIPYIKIVICEVDWWAQAVMCGLCGMILGCLVFKANCETYANYCLQDMALITNCTVAGVAHFIVHFLLLLYVVPMMGKECEDPNKDLTYEDCAKEEARSWFSMNPVHCLRSKHIHGDSPPCHLCAYGKESLLEANPKIGIFYDQDPPEDEPEMDLGKSFGNLRSSWSSSKAETEPEKETQDEPVP